MYKELNNSLKSYKPTDVELDKIKSRFLEHRFIHRGDNLFGEEYEAWVYEYLKSWASNNPNVSSFVLKDSKFHSDKIEGLNYDKNGQIIYLKNGKKVAEYDGLFIYKDKVVFVESSVSELRSYFRKIEDKLIIKRDFLVELFGTNQVYYLMVTRPRKRSLVYRSLPHLVLFTLRCLDLNNLSLTESVKESDYKNKNPHNNMQVIELKSDKFIELKSISFSSSSF